MTDRNPADPYPTSPYPAYPPQAPAGHYPGPPPAFGPPEPKKSRLWLWLTLAGVVLVLCCGGGTVAGLVLYNASDDSPIALPTITKSPSPAASSPSSTSSVTLTVPATLGGYPKFTDTRIDPLLDSLKSQMEGIPGANVNGVVSGVYGNPAKQQMRLFVAAKAYIPNPDGVIAGMLTGFKASGAKTSNFADVPTGPLGGAAQCGDVDQNGVEMALCVWADSETFGMIFFYFAKASTVKSTFVQARGEIESRA